MNLEELRTFIAIVEAKSLVAASRRLHVTQSTVTARMNSLEEDIGKRLLHRGKAGAELTSAGFKFLRYAELMIQLWGHARHEIALPAGFNGLCNIGLEFDLWSGLAERFVDLIQHDDRRIAASVWPAEQMQLNRWLRMGLVDVAFCYSLQGGDGFSNRVVMEDEIILVATDGTYNASLGPSYIYVDHGEQVRRQHAEAYPYYTAGLVMASSQWALDTLLRRGGSGYLPRRIAQPLIDSRQLCLVDGAVTFRRRVYLVENPSTVVHWNWYEEALANTFGTTAVAPNAQQ